MNYFVLILLASLLRACYRNILRYFLVFFYLNSIWFSITLEYLPLEYLKESRYDESRYDGDLSIPDVNLSYRRQGEWQRYAGAKVLPCVSRCFELLLEHSYIVFDLLLPDYPNFNLDLMWNKMLTQIMGFQAKITQSDTTVSSNVFSWVTSLITVFSTLF